MYANHHKSSLYPTRTQTTNTNQKPKKKHKNANLNQTNSYKILASQAIAGMTDLQKAAKIIMDASGLDPEGFRLGNTKAWSNFCSKKISIL